MRKFRLKLRIKNELLRKTLSIFFFINNFIYNMVAKKKQPTCIMRGMTLSLRKIPPDFVCTKLGGDVEDYG